jgi:hypothetical protein
MGLFNFLAPTPASHAKGTCRAMKIAFSIKMEQAAKNGDIGLPYGEFAKRALSTRPGWKQLAENTFKEARTGDTITVDVDKDSLKDVVKKVLEIETPSFLLVHKDTTREQVESAVYEALQAVDKYFAT